MDDVTLGEVYRVALETHTMVKEQNGRVRKLEVTVGKHQWALAGAWTLLSGGFLAWLAAWFTKKI